MRSERRPRVLGIALSALALAGVSAFVAVRSSGAASQPAPPPPFWLSQLSQTIASQNGDSVPASASWAITNAASIAAVVGSTGGNASQTEYVVVLTGSFVDSKSFAPPGAPSPSGNEIVFTADPSTQQVQDFSIGDTSQFPSQGMPQGMASFQPAA